MKVDAGSRRWRRLRGLALVVVVLLAAGIPFNSDPVVNGQLTHSGDSRLARHIGNAVLREDARGARLAKERKDSPRRIDAAVAAVIAHARAAALAGTVRHSISL